MTTGIGAPNGLAGASSRRRYRYSFLCVFQSARFAWRPLDAPHHASPVGGRLKDGDAFGLRRLL